MSTNDTVKLTDSQRNDVLTAAMDAIKKQGKHRRINEVKDYHPLVAQWLTANGYEYEHHHRMDDFGIVDFLATHKDGHRLLVEAKCVRAKIKEAVLQVRVYQVQMPDAKAVVIAPPELLKENDFPMADKHGVKIVTVELSPELKSRINAQPIKVTICEGCGQPIYYHMYTKDGKQVVETIGNTLDGKPEKPTHAWPPLPKDKRG